MPGVAVVLAQHPEMAEFNQRVMSRLCSIIAA